MAPAAGLEGELMSKRGTAWAIGGVVALLAAAAALLLGLWPLGADGVHRLDAGDNGAVVEVKVGEQVSVVLEGNPTTGYAWQVTAIDPAVLAPVGEPDYESSSDADGAGGVYTFHFDIVGAGETEVVLQYFPSWEEPTDAAGRFTFTAVVG
jgi:inhibitor of cysteine peptidase